MTKWPDFLSTLIIRFICGIILGVLLCLLISYRGILRSFSHNNLLSVALWLSLWGLAGALVALFTTPKRQTPWDKTIGDQRPSSPPFASPSALREFALETATQLRQAGMTEAAKIMERAATHVTSSGWEWLGELGAAAKIIQKRFVLPEGMRDRIMRIAKAAASKHPYE